MLIGVRGRAARAGGARGGEFAELLGIRVRAEPPGSLIGLEHEFRVLDDVGATVDFRELIHTLPIQGLRLDPGDANAYRCRSGLSVTADGAEAEFATPPIGVRPGFAGDVAKWAGRGAAEIESALPPGMSLEGFSTHLSIAMDDAINERVCQLFAETFSAGFAMLIEGPRSQGIYVRPRPGRVELCGEFVSGARLEAVATFAVGAVLACARAVAGDQGAPLPGRLRVTTLAGVERYGLRVRREGYGIDLYSDGRAGVLETVDGPRISAQGHLAEEWQVARAAVRGRATARELRRVDDIVRGAAPLGIESSQLAADGGGGASKDGGVAPLFGRRERASGFGAAVGRLERPAFTVTPRVLTWEMAVFRIEGAREAFAAIPRSALAQFEDRLARGKLDRVLARALARPAAIAVLRSRAQVAEPGLFDQVGDASALVAPERDPEGSAAPAEASGRLGKSSRAGKGGSRVRAVANAGPLARAGKVGSRRWKVLPLTPLSVAPVRAAPGDATPGSAPPAVTRVAPDVPSRGWVTAAVVAGVGVIAVAAALGGYALTHDSGWSGGSPPTVTGTHDADTSPAATVGATETPGRASPTAAPTETRAAAATVEVVATAAASPTARAVETAPAGASATGADATATATPTRTPTVRVTETPRPTATFTPTSTPTPTPTATPFVVIPLPPTAAPVCTPVNGKPCP